MASLAVTKVYYVPHRDLLVIAGKAYGTPPKPGGSIELPRDLAGPGWVPIADVQKVAFGGVEQTCVILAYDVVVGAPMMEFSALEGIDLDYR